MAKNWDRSADHAKKQTILEAIAKDSECNVVEGVRTDSKGSAIDAIIGPTGNNTTTQ